MFKNLVFLNKRKTFKSKLFIHYSMKNFVKYWVPVYACMLLIIYFSLTSQPTSEIGGFSLNFNFLHLAAYFTLCLFVTKSIKNSKFEVAKRNPFLFSIFYCFLFGSSIEFLQSFVPGRITSLADILYNTSAIFFYPVSIMAVRTIRNKKSILPS